MLNQKGLAPIIIVLVIMIILVAGGILAWQNWLRLFGEEKTVLCRAQYSASIGGQNEPISGVAITSEIARARIQPSIVFETDDYGRAYIPFRTGILYRITVIYKNIKKSATLKYNGEDVLMISINPNEPSIAGIEFLKPLPLERK